jgi:hypothetical protein
MTKTTAASARVALGKNYNRRLLSDNPGGFLKRGMSPQSDYFVLHVIARLRSAPAIQTGQIRIFLSFIREDFFSSFVA